MKVGKCIPALLWFVRMTTILWIVCFSAAASSRLNVTQEGGILLKSRSPPNCSPPGLRTYCDGDILCVKIEEIDYICMRALAKRCAIQASTVELDLRQFLNLATNQSQTVSGGAIHSRYAAKSAVGDCVGAPVRTECEGGLVCKILEAGILYKCCPGVESAPP